MRSRKAQPSVCSRKIAPSNAPAANPPAISGTVVTAKLSPRTVIFFTLASARPLRRRIVLTVGAITSALLMSCPGSGQ
ncbi:MAG: hypothetical protein HYY24_10860 [Verrucomicrobia bacterium]|nr:hypothetical protein [Verrucomicrobiota bacterium]